MQLSRLRYTPSISFTDKVNLSRVRVELATHSIEGVSIVLALLGGFSLPGPMFQPLKQLRTMCFARPEPV